MTCLVTEGVSQVSGRRMMQSSSRVSPCTTFVLVLIVSMIVFFFIFLPITQTKSWLLTTQRKLVNFGFESDTTTRMSMGSKKDCDDGKSNLTMDLGDMEEATTCYTGVGEMFYFFHTWQKWQTNMKVHVSTLSFNFVTKFYV